MNSNFKTSKILTQVYFPCSMFTLRDPSDCMLTDVQLPTLKASRPFSLGPHFSSLIRKWQAARFDLELWPLSMV